jgi:hypothetical protein
MKTACHEHWKREYQPKTPSVLIPRKRTLLEAFLHSDPADQSQDEWERWASASPIAATAQSSSLFRWHVDNMESFPTLHQMALDTFQYLQCLQNVRESLAAPRSSSVPTDVPSRKTLWRPQSA